jgi:hypothetical protein
LADDTDDDLPALRAKLVAVRSMGMRRAFPSSGNDDEAPRWVVSEVVSLKAIERGSPWSRLHELSFEVTPCVWAVIDNGQRLAQVSAADAQRDAALPQFDQAGTPRWRWWGCTARWRAGGEGPPWLPRQ